MRWLALAVLAGCGFTGQGWYDANVRDLDGDGSVGERFGGPDCRDDDPAITDCDADRDGFLSVAVGGDDCDDSDAAVAPGAAERCNQIDDDCDGLIDNDDPDASGPAPLFPDADGDGFGDPGDPQACQVYAIPGDTSSGIFVIDGNDCRDDDAGIHPAADERCDGFDNNCDGVVDDVGLWFLDHDGDGYGRAGTQATGACDLQPGLGLAAVAGDCDDDDHTVHPGRPEVPYDGVDANCNGGLDDWDVDFDGHVPDAHFAAAQAANQLLPVDERWDLVAGDCDDLDPARFVGNTEICDGVDNDCDQAVDAADLAQAGPTDELTLRSQVTQVYLDADGDGHFGTPVLLCPGAVDPSVHGVASNDCYDGGVAPAGLEGADPAAIHDDAVEVCDRYDNDCDGRVDFTTTPQPGLAPHYLDGDDDGFGAVEVYACGIDDGAGIVAVGGDCNDTQETVFPGAPEICGDAVRQDCSTASIYDCDGDGYEGAYVGGGSGHDCEDTIAVVNPGNLLEICDGYDNDCDGLTDSADTDNLDAGEQPFWYPDADLDGFGDGAQGVQQCDRPAGHVLDGTDCDDSDAQTSPATVWSIDNDGDGYGNDTTADQSCLQPGPGYVTQGGDCNDSSAAVNPGVLWMLDLDGDQVGDPLTETAYCLPPVGEPWVPATNGVDCNDADAGVTAASTWYADLDGDGVGAGQAVEACVRPTIDGVVYVASSNDCDDGDANVRPGRDEVCNGRDDDCDGLVDDADAVTNATGPVGYPDADDDGFGAPDGGRAFCFAVPAGYVSNADDCDDTLDTVNPAATEVCDNGVDDDCDGAEQVPDWYEDLDGDGFGSGPIVVTDCAPPAPSGYASASGDCDDDEPLTFPGAAELDACDAVDSNCDGIPEPRLTWYFDADVDGFGDGATAFTSCNPPTEPPDAGLTGEWVLQGGDCDDEDATITFGRIWYLDGDGDGLGDDASTQFQCPQYANDGSALDSFLLVDVNDNGSFDLGDTLLTVFPGDCNDDNAAIGLARTYYPDHDDDTWGDGLGLQRRCPDALGNPPEGLVDRPGDCRDDRDDVFPGADETDGDGLDSNCDGLDNNESGIIWYPDADGDGFGDRTATGTTTYVNPSVTNNVDCDDADADVVNGIFVYTDDDLDTFGAGLPRFVGRCAPVGGESLVATDCDDTDFDVRPGTTEVCDDVDQDCDGLVDEGLPTSTAFRDLDGDGFGHADVTVSYCGMLVPDGYVADSTDCDDLDAAVSPGAPEVCDAIDNNCDGTMAEPTFWYLDADQDGVGGPVGIETCVAPGGLWLATNDDCDDTNPLVNPFADEICDGVDNNCDGAVGFTEDDVDGDGVHVCAGDCDDIDAARHPGAVEVCDGVPDNDCNPATPDPEVTDNDGDGFVVCYDVDDDDPTVPSQGVAWYRDADGDGYGDQQASVVASARPAGYVFDDTDCDDGDAAVHPGAVELCNGIDDDCDRMVADGSFDVWRVTPGSVIDSSILYYAIDFDDDGSFGVNSLLASCDDLGPSGTAQIAGAGFTIASAESVPSVTSWLDCEDGSTSGVLTAQDRDGDGVGAFDVRLPLLEGCGLSVPVDFVEVAEGNVDCAPDDPVRSVGVGDPQFVDLDGDGFFSGYRRGSVCVAAVASSAGTDCNDDEFSTVRTASEAVLRVSSQTQLDAALQNCDLATIDLEDGPFVAGVTLSGVADLTLRGEDCPAEPCLDLSTPIGTNVVRLEDLTVTGNVSIAGGTLDLAAVSWVDGQIVQSGGVLEATASSFEEVALLFEGGETVLEDCVFDGGALDGSTGGNLTTSSCTFTDTFVSLVVPWEDVGSTLVFDTQSLNTYVEADLVGTRIHIGPQPFGVAAPLTCDACAFLATASDAILFVDGSSLELVDTDVDNVTIQSDSPITARGGTWVRDGTEPFVRQGNAPLVLRQVDLRDDSVLPGAPMVFSDQAEVALIDCTATGGLELVQSVGGTVLLDRVVASSVAGATRGTASEVVVRDSDLDFTSGPGFELSDGGSGARTILIEQSNLAGQAPAPFSPLFTIGQGTHSVRVSDTTIEYQGGLVRTNGGGNLVELDDVDVDRPTTQDTALFVVAPNDLLSLRSSALVRPSGFAMRVFGGEGFVHLTDTVVWTEDPQVTLLDGPASSVFDHVTLVAPSGAVTQSAGLLLLDNGGELTMIDSAIGILDPAVGDRTVSCAGAGRLTAEHVWVTDSASVDPSCGTNMAEVRDATNTGQFEANSTFLRSGNPQIFPFYGHTAN